MASLPKFDVEHVLSMYATSFVIMPAYGIYDEEVVEHFKKNLATCHIYVIGLLPKVDVERFELTEKGKLLCEYTVGGASKTLEWAIWPGSKLEGDGTADTWVVKPDGSRMRPTAFAVQRRLNRELDAMPFEVLYIGQAYGEDGSRNALDRLKKHETLQKIAVQGVPESKVVTLLLLEIAPNRIITAFYPKAQQQDQSSVRIGQGLDKLFGTSEAERVSLFEAALIRYFQPAFNKQLKDSFPSTNLKLLTDCYDKDFHSLVAEIVIDDLPFKMFSESVAKAQYHEARFELTNDADRKVFFAKP